ncbi:hypothetical protein [Clostridium botulinum]|uniref:Major facilitator superfamily (MFS) profile domain-containing protein n=2 Tax=Clostridium botulinum TaxID=1491 RepID=A0A9Q1UY16_CLOBO|nr:hypothetical protein [Clostridium botulinum]KEI02675.1 hypothetical protein Z953_06410 [Clostridium botulinum D str. 16868]KEI03979.1 hypothetical protein Y848_03785 [Clostridium botulinum C/D str. Sp77]KLU76544.1 hypothetical protein CBC3_03115 [Clostridium botulinum V891]KOA72815.1 hypothetical protein ADU78_14085 [Clostridium botulinum]KOA73937.1 hypothetical protein ADU77_13115 [Clostridium botulinum]
MSMTLTLPWFQTNKQLGIVSYGIAMAINTFGMLIDFSCLATIDIKVEKRFRVFIASGIIISITMIIYSITMNIFVIFVLFFINGFSLAVLNSLIQISLQNAVDSNMRTRVFEFKRAISSALMPVGMVLAGILAEKISMNFIILTDYTIFLILIIYLLFLTQVREIINN